MSEHARAVFNRGSGFTPRREDAGPDGRGVKPLPQSRTGREQLSGGGFELLDENPAVAVEQAEYWRLLGYPRDFEPSERALELAAWARQWFADHGRPWVYLREAELQIANGTLRLDGVEFQSKQLHDHLVAAESRRAMLVAVSAGAACELHARQLWQESKPDEYFFLEMFGSAVVEHLMATMSGRICDLAGRDGLVAIPHYSPGYTGWDVADQGRLFELIAGGMAQPLPEPLEVLASGMLRPKKSLLAVVGLSARDARGLQSLSRIPCETCAFSPCQYRRRPYRHAASAVSGADSGAAITAAMTRSRPAPLTAHARYTVSPRALQKWSQERVALEPRADGSVLARFRFDGTTCSNMGRPLAFEYVFELGPADEGYAIRGADCRPAADDEGHRFMCAYLADADALMSAISTEKPLLGRPLDDVLAWSRASAPSGCYCTAAARAHKWGLALEAIHYTLVHSPNGAPPRSELFSLPQP